MTVFDSLVYRLTNTSPKFLFFISIDLVKLEKMLYLLIANRSERTS